MAKRKNPADATMRNVRAARTRTALVLARVGEIEEIQNGQMFLQHIYATAILNTHFRRLLQLIAGTTMTADFVPDDKRMTAIGAAVIKQAQALDKQQAKRERAAKRKRERRPEYDGGR
jgi:hypothetical protein